MASWDPHRQTRLARQARKATANTRRDLDPPGASQAIESCKRRSSSAAAGGLTAGIGHLGHARTPARRRWRRLRRPLPLDASSGHACAATALAVCVGVPPCTVACARCVRELFLEARVGSGRRGAAPARRGRAVRRILLVVAAGRTIGSANRGAVTSTRQGPSRGACASARRARHQWGRASRANAECFLTREKRPHGHHSG